MCLAEQIQFTEDVEAALKEQNLQQLELELSAKLEHYTTVDSSSDEQTNTGRPTVFHNVTLFIEYFKKNTHRCVHVCRM